MMFRWLSRETEVKVPPVNTRPDKERDILGLTLLREGVLARKLSNEIQETLARGAMARLRNDS